MKCGYSGTCDLEALPVDDGRAGFVILLLADPHLLEGGQRCQDRPADPDGVLALWGSNDLDLHRGRGKSLDLFAHAVLDLHEHRGAARQHNVGVQVLSDIHVTLHDRVVGGLVDAGVLTADQGGLEEHLRASEPLVADGDDLPVGQLVVALQGGARGGVVHFLFVVNSDEAQLLLDVTDNLALSGGRESVAALSQDLLQPISEISPGQVQTENGVGESVTLVDWHSVRHTITRVKHNSGGAARCVQGQHGLDGDVHHRCREGLEHELSHLLTVSLGVEGSLSQEDGVILRGSTELIVESVMPDLLHVLPVVDDAVLNRVPKGEHTPLDLSLITDVRLFSIHSNHNAGVTRATNDGREHGTRGIIPSETGLAHPGTVVNNKSGLMIVCHCKE